MRQSVPSSRPNPAPFDIGQVTDRRTEPRLSAEVLGLETDARLTLGVHVRVVNVSRGGALLEVQEWLRPGTRTELRLSRPADGAEEPEVQSAMGSVARCWVHRLSPLRYRAALVFAGATPVVPEGEGAVDAVLLRERAS